MTKAQIIKAYQKAQTVKELEGARERTRGNYNKLFSYEQSQIKEVYKQRMIELKC